MITLAQYVGPHAKSKDWTQWRRDTANLLLLRVNALMARAERDGVVFPVNPVTGSQVSGTTYGGFRPQDCPIGKSNSTHKDGAGIDLFDPNNRIDDWCMDHQSILVANAIWLEHPDHTNTWSHWQGRGVKSGNRVFKP